MAAPVSIFALDGPPATPARLVRASAREQSASPGFAPVPITDGFYIAWSSPSMTDEPLWVRAAGHLEEN